MNCKRLPFLFAVMSLGGCTLVAQTLFIRQFLVVFVGNELCISALLGSWLLGVSLGALFSSFLAHRRRSPGGFLALIGALIFLVPIQIYAVGAMRLLFSIPAGQSASLSQVLLSSLLITLPVSFITGFSFAFACSAFPSPSCDADTIGSVYIAEAAGALLTGFLFTFFLVPYLGTFFILAIISAGLFASIILIALASRPCWMRALGIAAVALLLTAGWVFGWIENIEAEAELIRLRGLGFSVSKKESGWQLIDSRNSQYQHLSLLKREGQYALLENGEVSFVFPDEIGYEHSAHFVMVQHPRPQRILVIGSGAGGLLRQVLKHPVEELDYVELDPAVIDIVLPYLSPLDREALNDSRISVSHMDGRRFVKLAKKRYDLIFLNAPPPSTAALNRFYTLQFFREVQQVLAPGGILFLSVPSTVHLGEDVASFAGSIGLTLREVFPQVLVTAGECNMFLAGETAARMSFEPDTLRARFEERKIVTSYFSPYFYEATDDLWPEKVKFTEDRLRAQGRLNTDISPITYYLNLVLWGHYSSPGLVRFFRKIQSIPYIVFPVILLSAGIMICLLLRRRATQGAADKNIRFSILLAICATGFAGMAMETVIIFSFQSICGYVYEKVGLIIACFMAGLVAGAMIIKTCKTDRAAGFSRFIAVELLLLTFSIAAPLLIHWLAGSAGSSLPYWAAELVFYLLTALIGALVGAQFPLANRLFIQTSGGTITSAALTDMADHLGAFIGAFLTGMLFIPLFGSIESCWFIAAGKLSTLLILLGQFAGKPNTQAG